MSAYNRSGVGHDSLVDGASSMWLSVAYMVVVMVVTGVWRNRVGTKWQAGIWINGKTMHLGVFEDETEVAKVNGSKGQ